MKNFLKRLLSASFLLMFVVAVGSNSINAQENPPAQQGGETVVDKVQSNEDVSEFAELLQVSGFADVLAQQGPYTVLAPSNEALRSGDFDLEQVKQNPGQAQQVVQSHLYQGELGSEKVESSMGVGVEDTDDSAANGTVHVVDNVVQKQQQ